jgi:DNA repair exonuclease SbcCD ATPase subunit
MTDLEAKKHELEQNQEHYEEQYELIEAAKNYLEAAKSNLAVSYVKTMEEKFGGYLQEFLADEFSKYNISIDLDIQIECEGEKRQLDYFSTGYKDIIDICMRFSLVDALFPEEKPFLILDDPFVNLDNEKLPLAKKILDQISAKYQVLHMICHDVRK